MDFNIFSLTKIGLGVFLGIAVGVLLRFLVIKILIIVSIPAVILFFLDYMDFYKVNWLQLNEKWYTYVMPPIVDVYSYLSQHALIGIIPGVMIGFSLGFLLTKKFGY